MSVSRSRHCVTCRIVQRPPRTSRTPSRQRCRDRDGARRPGDRSRRSHASRGSARAPHPPASRCGTPGHGVVTTIPGCLVDHQRLLVLVEDVERIQSCACSVEVAGRGQRNLHRARRQATLAPGFRGRRVPFNRRRFACPRSAAAPVSARARGAHRPAADRACPLAAASANGGGARSRAHSSAVDGRRSLAAMSSSQHEGQDAEHNRGVREVERSGSASGR